jgi:uncharacterized membrane protein
MIGPQAGSTDSLPGNLMSPPTTPPRDSRARLAVLVATLLAALFFAGTLAAPLLERAGAVWGPALRLVYAPVCHQNVERSIALGDGTHGVCARCSGLYAGGVLGLVAATLWLAGTGRRPRPVWLALAVAPTIVDALLPWIGVAGLSNVPRLLLAIPTGGVAALFLAAGIADLFSSDRNLQQSDTYVQLPRALEEVDG